MSRLTRMAIEIHDNLSEVYSKEMSPKEASIIEQTFVKKTSSKDLVWDICTGNMFYLELAERASIIISEGKTNLKRLIGVKKGEIFDPHIKELIEKYEF